jgi:hypothetical protein
MRDLKQVYPLASSDIQALSKRRQQLKQLPQGDEYITVPTTNILLSIAYINSV